MNERPAPTPPGKIRPVFARHAASLLLWRQGGQGLKVLMGVRGAGHRFMPNRLVFPGGAVDPADKRAVAAAEPDSVTLSHLSRNAPPRLARGLVIAAARELEEETGLSFGHPPRLDRIRYLCRAVTPPSSPIRFNARFLLAPVDAVSGELGDSEELGAVRFYAVAEALELGLMEVTREVLSRLCEYLALPCPDRRTSFFAYRRRRWEAD